MVLTESYERIHRSNLIGMGILPLEFPAGTDRRTLGLTGDELIDVGGLNSVTPKQIVPVKITHADGRVTELNALCRIDTQTELEYYRHGGILCYVIRQMLA